MLKTRRDWKASVVNSAGMMLVLVGLIVFFALKSPRFLSADNFSMMAKQIPAAVVVAVGMTFVLIIGHIDLSVGSVLGLSGAVLGLCLDRFQWPLPLSIAACLMVGLITGAANGLITIHWKLPSFIVTLGMLEIARGLTFMVTDMRTLYLGAKIEGLAKASWGGLSLLFLLSMAVMVLGQVILSRTPGGRHLIALGANKEAARLSGIRTTRLKLAVFVSSGVLCSVAAVIQTARLASANPNSGAGMELEAIAAVVIGGTSLMGGRGSVAKSFLGVLVIALLSSGLAQIGAQEPAKRVITGCVIVLAVVSDYYRNRWMQRRG